MNEVAELVEAAAAGSSAAWDDLVARFGGLIWSIARSHGLERADATEVSQTTWLRLAEHITTLSDPARVGAWLTTTARRESIRIGRLASRQILVDPWDLLEHSGGDEPLDAAMLREEQDVLVQQAMALLPLRCRELLVRLVASATPPSYASLSAEVGVPIGSIGPTRSRCLDHLRRLLDEVSGSEAPSTAAGLSGRTNR